MYHTLFTILSRRITNSFTPCRFLWTCKTFTVHTLSRIVLRSVNGNTCRLRRCLISIGIVLCLQWNNTLVAAGNDGAKQASRFADVHSIAGKEVGRETTTPEQDLPEKASADKTQANEQLSLLGQPLASGMIKLLEQEIRDGLAKRQTNNFDRFLHYAAARLDATAKPYTGTEIAGNCRLRWYDWLMRHPLEAPAEAERFTRKLHECVLAGRDGFASLAAIAAEKVDCGRQAPVNFTEVETPEQALEAVKQCLAAAKKAYAKALVPLTNQQVNDLSGRLYPVMVGGNRIGHTLDDRGTGRRLCDLLEKMDRAKFYLAAGSLAELLDQKLLDQLKCLPCEESVQVPGVTGTVAMKIETSTGTILIGGKGRNVYSMEKLTDVCAIIDLGGNDEYLDGTVGPHRPVLAILELEGNDVYRSNLPGVQGGAILGISMLMDLAGDDSYQAVDVAQGSSLAGVGILVDTAGNDRYAAQRRVQGQTMGGLGVLIDRAGNDDYRATMWAQGFAGPLGFALLDDLQGNDHYFCGGKYRDSYPETPGLEGWGQGVGAGLRQVANGGIGVILDGGGDDIYEFDYLSHGGGYWCGVGFARDFGGNDQRLITRKAFGGGSRTEPNFQRFACGWGCHYSLGFCFDDYGNDIYEGTIMGTGMAWDCSVGMLCDFGGDDEYKATGGITQGTGAQMGLGILFDYDGNDKYQGYGQGYAVPSMSYHPLPDCGGNFGFCIDYGGNDQYGCGALNNSYLQRGSTGGFLIDRPRQDEFRQTVAGKAQDPSGPKSKN
jgi:hypothetical protein